MTPAEQGHSLYALTHIFTVIYEQQQMQTCSYKNLPNIKWDAPDLCAYSVWFAAWSWMDILDEA